MLPWKDTSREQEQIRFIQRWKGGEDTFTELCRQFSISRKTGYKRVERYKLWGLEGLGDRSRAPHTHPNSTPQPVIERLIRAKGEHPTWGPKKLVAWLSRVEPWMKWPASSTAGQILDRAGLVRRRKRRRHTAPWSEPFAAAERPNDVWSIDFKGWFRTEDGVRIDPLTIQDGFSRCLLVCQGLKRPRGPEVRAVCERAFREYGLPRVMRSDNGVPFASVAVGGLSSLSVWWIKLGILPERIEPAHPEQNGRLERLHRTLKAETATPPRSSIRTQQRAFDEFRRIYNEHRPHEALGQRPPALLHAPSLRSYPAEVRSPEYEADVTIRRVRGNGGIKWRGEIIYLSEALRGEPVGLRPSDDRHWSIQFGPLIIGLLDDHAKRVVHTPTKVLPMCSV